MDSADPIRHVVLLLLENHSFDQMLGCMTAVYPGLEGIDPTRSNVDARGATFFQRPTTEMQMRFDPKHEHANVLAQLQDHNGGFVLDFERAYPHSTHEDRQNVMGYYPLDWLPALHPLARQFTVCDKWFSSLPGPTWPNRLFALSGTSSGQLKMPDGFWHPELETFFDQSQDTIFDRLDEANRSWKVYHYDLPCSWILVHQRRPENLVRYHDIDMFFDDTRAGSLPEFTFIEPKYSGHDQNDDHPPHNIMKAEKLIGDVYNGIRSNPTLWESTLLVVCYDEHGGFFDHVPPPRTVAPDDRTTQFGFDRLGVRVPAILISPWLPARVDHTVLDHTSLLRYLLDKWTLGPLGRRTAQANSVDTALQFLPRPRTDTIPFIRIPNRDLYAPQPELEEWDWTSHHRSLHLFADRLERELDRRKGITHPEVGFIGSWTKSLTTSLRRRLGILILRLGYRLSRTHQETQRRMIDITRKMKEQPQVGAREIELRRGRQRS